MKPIWIVLISVVVTAILFGGGMYYVEKTKANAQKDDLNSQITSLQKQISDLKKASTATTTAEETTTSTTATAATVDPKTVVEKFYNLWENYSSKNSGTDTKLFPATSKDLLNQSIYAAPALIKYYDDTIAGFEQTGGYDPISCAQITYQGEISVTEISKTNTTAQEQLNIPKFDDVPLTVDLELIDGLWKITKVNCSL